MPFCCGFGGGFPIGFFALMMLGMLVGLVLLVILIWALVRWLNGMSSSGASRRTAQQDGRSAEDILRERYARGEIDAATFDEMLSRLRSSGGHSERT